MPILLLCLVFMASLSLAQTPSSFPWPEGEKLTYLIQWGPIDAAEATFTARTETKREGIERFELFLRSRGPIEAFYPIRTRITSLTQLNPWRTTEYIQDRNEEETSAIAAPCPTTRSDWGASFPHQAKPRRILIFSKDRMRTLVPCSITSGPIHGKPVPPSHGRSLKIKNLFSQKYPVPKSACSKSRMILPDA